MGTLGGFHLFALVKSACLHVHLWVPAFSPFENKPEKCWAMWHMSVKLSEEPPHCSLQLLLHNIHQQWARVPVLYILATLLTVCDFGSSSSVSVGGIYAFWFWLHSPDVRIRVLCGLSAVYLLCGDFSAGHCYSFFCCCFVGPLLGCRIVEVRELPTQPSCCFTDVSSYSRGCLSWSPSIYKRFLF